MNRLLKHRYINVFIIATLVALCVRIFIFEDFRVASDSMSPSLKKGDILLVSKSHYSLKVPFSSVDLLRLQKPQRGDIIAFSLPEKPGSTFIKRVIGIAGDRVEIKEGKLIVNRTEATYQTLATDSDTKEVFNAFEALLGQRYKVNASFKKTLNYGPVDVPKGHVFTLGDNRPFSVDSRNWGPVPINYIRGKAKWLWFSLSPKSISEGRFAKWIF